MSNGLDGALPMPSTSSSRDCRQASNHRRRCAFPEEGMSTPISSIPLPNSLNLRRLRNERRLLRVNLLAKPQLPRNRRQKRKALGFNPNRRAQTPAPLQQRQQRFHHLKPSHLPLSPNQRFKNNR